MALTLFQNTYLEDPSNYLENDSAWSEATYEEQERALIDATKLLDQLLWAGSAVSASQPLAWPRVDFTYFDPVLNLHVKVDEDTVPIRLEKAVAKLAVHLITYPSVLKGYEASYDSISLGPITVTNSNASSDPGSIPKIPLEVFSLVDPLLRVSRTTSIWWRAN